MSDARFVAMLFVIAISVLFWMVSDMLTGVVVGVLLAWGMSNDWKNTQLEKRLKRYIEAHNRISEEYIKESDRHDHRSKYSEQTDPAGSQPERTGEALRSEQADDKCYRERPEDSIGNGSSEDRPNITLHRGRAA